jgi:DNA-directed RNA polymerase specialized sigma24 family protein
MLPTFTHAPGNSLLIDRCLAGEQDAWIDWFATYDRIILASIRHELGADSRDFSLVDELAQEVRLALVKRPNLLQAFDPCKGTIAAYLAGISRREVRHYYYHQRHKRKEIVSFRDPEDLPSTEFVEALENLQWEEVLARLTVRQQEFLLTELGLVPESEFPPFSDKARRKMRYRIEKKLESEE